MFKVTVKSYLFDKMQQSDVWFFWYGFICVSLLVILWNFDLFLPDVMQSVQEGLQWK